MLTYRVTSEEEDCSFFDINLCIATTPLITVGFTKHSIIVLTRMWAYAQRDGHPLNIGGTLLKIMRSKSSIIPFVVPPQKCTYNVPA